MKNHWIDILKYNLWANHRIVDLLNQYDESISTRPIVNSFPSIELTMKHLWGAEKIWLMRLQGNSAATFPVFNGSLQDVFQMGLKVSAEFKEFIENQQEAFFDSKCDFQDTKGNDFSLPVQQIIHHAMNHSTYHRGQITTLGRQANFGEIKSTDYISYVTSD
ncbi:MAG: DinB family protein [Saprospiraceae bacterium]